MNRSIPRLLGLFLLSAALTACDRDAPAPAAAPASSPAASAPADPTLAGLYAQTCKACHTNAASGAPQTGDVQAWAPRLAQGMDVLLDHTVNGYNGMPPLGSCSDCTEDEFRALIEFMAQSQGAAP